MDACIQVYGTAQLLFKIAKDNDLQIDSAISIGDELTYDESLGIPQMKKALTQRGLMVGNEGDLPVLTGFDDYFLPSIFEFGKIRENMYLNGLGNVVLGLYWTSTESTAEWAFNYDVLTDVFDEVPKGNSYQFRPIRTFEADVGAYSLLDIGPAGGYIFYIDGTTYYEASPANIGPHVWSNIVDEVADAYGVAIGTGQQNTIDIITQVGHITSAALLCSDLVINAPGAYCEEYQAVYDSDLVKADSADAAAQNIFVETLVNGDVWYELDRLPVYASHADGRDSLKDWLDPTNNAKVATLVNAPAWVKYQGYISNGTTQYIRSHYVPSINKINYAAANASIFIYSRTNTDESVVSLDAGARDADFQISADWSSGLFRGSINTGTDYSTSIPDSRGFYYAEADGIAADGQKAYKNGTERTTANLASPTECEYEVYALCRNDQDTPVNFSNRENSILGIGGSLGAAKQLILYNAFQALMTYYGTQV